MSLTFYNTRTLRAKLTKAQRNYINNLYKEISDLIGKEAERLKAYDNVSAMSRRSLLNSLSKQIDEEIENINKNIEETVKNNIKEVAKQSVKDNAKYANSIGMNIIPNLVYVPNEIVKRIATGKIYDKKWTLSKAIWGENKKLHKDVRTIIAKGVAMNKGTYDIAKDIQVYMNPYVNKGYEWAKQYPYTNRQVAYNAKRLADTLVSHAYQLSLVQNTKYNPFVYGLKWLISNSGHVCDICADREGKVYKPAELPLDHPNGMCTFEAVIVQNDKQIADRITNWYNGKKDKALDKYSKFLKGEQPIN